MVDRKKPRATAPSIRAIRGTCIQRFQRIFFTNSVFVGKAKATVNVEIEQPVPESSVRLGSPIGELEAGLPNKRRKTAKNTTVTVRTRAQEVSVQILARGSNDSSAVSSASSVAHGGEEIDTPATTISTGSVGGGKRMLKTVTERLGGTEDSDSVLTTRRRSTRFSQPSGIILDSDEEEEAAEEHGEDTADESEEDEFQPSEDESDECMEIEEEISTSRKGKGKARAAPAAPSSSSTRLETIVLDDDSELSDVPDTEMDTSNEGEGEDDATALAPTVIVRVPRHRRGGGMSRVS